MWMPGRQSLPCGISVVIGNELRDYVSIPFFSHRYRRPAIVAVPANICPRQYELVSGDENTRNKSIHVSLFDVIDMPSSSLDISVPLFYIARKNKVPQ
jgi:hypothetical protein